MLYSDNWFCLFVLGLLGVFCEFFFKFLNFQKRIFIRQEQSEKKLLNAIELPYLFMFSFKKKNWGWGYFYCFRLISIYFVFCVNEF